MDSTAKIYLQRARNEFSAAQLLFTVSNDQKRKQDLQLV